MGVTSVLLVMTAVFAWGLVSRRLERADVTGPVVFVTLGGLFAAVDVLDTPSAPETLKPLVELALVWVLFADAAGVRVHELRDDLGPYLRLLGVGLPLSILAGWALARWAFPSMDTWLALLVAAALAPTDAALGQAVVTDPHVPSRIRRLLTVESGLNDGIATPVVVFALAAAAAAEGVSDAPGLGAAVLELLVGAVVGTGLGLAGGTLVRRARDAGWAAEGFVGIAVLALAVVAYTASVTLHGNGFIAAFCGGLAFGVTAGRRSAAELEFLEQAGSLVSLLTWLAFGVIAVPIIGERADLYVVLYALLSLTVVRMLPVALCTLGAGLDRPTVLFMGWFGPRGLASLVFALLALEELGPRADDVVAVIGVTVLLSVVAHGFSARPLATWFGAEQSAGPPPPSGSP